MWTVRHSLTLSVKAEHLWRRAIITFVGHVTGVDTAGDLVTRCCSRLGGTIRGSACLKEQECRPCEIP